MDTWGESYQEKDYEEGVTRVISHTKKKNILIYRSRPNIKRFTIQASVNHAGSVEDGKTSIETL